MAACSPTPSAARKTRFCVVSFTSDWLFPTPENRTIVHALNAAAANVSFVEIETDRGHDAFLLDEPELFADRLAASSPPPPAAGASNDRRCRTASIAARSGAHRPEDHRRLRDAGRARARRRLRRRRAAAAARGGEAGRRARHRAVAEGRQRGGGARPLGRAGRRRPRPRHLSRRRLRFRHPEPDAAGDLQSARRAGAAPAHRPQGGRVVPEFRQLAHPRGSSS